MPNPSKTILFFGNEKLATGIVAEPLISQALINNGYEIEALVTGKEIPKHSAKLAVLAAYGKILPQSVLDEFPLGIINVHPSLLPQYRGPTPIEQAILDGTTKTGVSIMRLSSEMDAGLIYKQKAIHLRGNETKAALASQLQALGAELLLEVLPAVLDGSLKPRQQPHPERATYCKLIKKADGQLDWQKPAAQLEREVRAYTGWPGSFTKLADKDVIITQASVATTKPDKSLAIEAGDGNFLVIEKLKSAGKREMTAQEFLAGHAI